MKISRQEEQKYYLTVLNYEFKEIDQYKYLGISTTKDNREEILSRLATVDRMHWYL